MKYKETPERVQRLARQRREAAAYPVRIASAEAAKLERANAARANLKRLIELALSDDPLSDEDAFALGALGELAAGILAQASARRAEAETYTPRPPIVETPCHEDNGGLCLFWTPTTPHQPLLEFVIEQRQYRLVVGANYVDESLAAIEAAIGVQLESGALRVFPPGAVGPFLTAEQEDKRAEGLEIIGLSFDLAGSVAALAAGGA